jgi:hypothetical protein
MSIEPGSLGRPTERDIEAAWNAAEKPTQRSLEASMRAAGWDISASTIMRVKNSGFKPRLTQNQGRKSEARVARETAETTSPEAIAIKQVKAVAPPDAPAAAVADALLEAIRNLPPGAKDRVQALVSMDDQELENQTSKLVKVARYLLAEDLAQHTKLMMLAPDKAAKLYSALGTGLVPMVAPPMPDAGDGAKVVEHDVNEPRRLSPSAQAIADFRAKRGSVAA